jgi:DNA-binding CsgD family transcriptional regulator
MYRHIAIETIEELGDHRVRWTQTIPEPYRASEAFHRRTISLVEMFPRHFDLAEARIERVTITPREAEFIAQFPAVDLLSTGGKRTVSSAASGLVVKLEDAFSTIIDALRERPQRATNGDAASPSNRAGGTTSRADVREWADRLLLSPRQREVFWLLGEGRANKDIASTLRCSERNVEFHVGRILRAAKVSSRAELLVKVLSSPRP